MHLKRSLILTLWVLVAACQGRPAHIPVMEAALYDTSSVYYTDFSTYPQVRDQLPVGIFDSGTGGLTVMEAILGSRLLDSEHYIYLGDQANMPYGNYPAEGKTDFLRELIFKDALFLLGHRAKVLVVACNTATAYGLDDTTPTGGKAFRNQSHWCDPCGGKRHPQQDDTGRRVCSGCAGYNRNGSLGRLRTHF